MGGVVFVISAKYAEHWERAVAAGFWETTRHVSVEAQDLLVFWLSGEKRVLGLAQAAAPVEPADYTKVARPWLASDPTIYKHRYRFALVDSTGDDSLTWPDLMTLVGQKPRRGANTAPISFDDTGALSLAEHFATTAVKTQAASSPGSPAQLSPSTPISKPFVKRVDYAAPATTKVWLNDPDQWGTGLAAHRKTENEIAAALMKQHVEPLDPIPGGPNFDLAWLVGETLVVCEVKSITAANERGQIRLGLGQVLDYAFVLTAAGHTVEPWLVVNRAPLSPHWTALCEANGVTLSWPGIVHGHLPSRSLPN